MLNPFIDVVLHSIVNGENLLSSATSSQDSSTQIIIKEKDIAVLKLKSNFTVTSKVRLILGIQTTHHTRINNIINCSVRDIWKYRIYQEWTETT
mgnify:CR=1 FL=1